MSKILSPSKSVRKYCLACTINQPKEVRLCPSIGCQFYPYRLGKGRPKLKVIRAFCLDCSGLSPMEVKECEFLRCPLFQYRFGKNQKRKGMGNTNNLKGGEKWKAIGN